LGFQGVFVHGFMFGLLVFRYSAFLCVICFSS